MQLGNGLGRFGLVAVTLHWLIAILFLLMIGIGLFMIRLKLGDPRLFPLFQFHKSLGVTIFALATLRLLWRGGSEVPALPGGLNAFERLAARATHIALYTALFLMPLTGWINVSASKLGIPTIVFGLFRLPHLAMVADSPNKEEIGHWASRAHEIIAWSALAMTGLHALAALRHHFILKDDVLRRMLPTRDLFQAKEKNQ